MTNSCMAILRLAILSNYTVKLSKGGIMIKPWGGQWLKKWTYYMVANEPVNQ